MLLEGNHSVSSVSQDGKNLAYITLHFVNNLQLFDLSIIDLNQMKQFDISRVCLQSATATIWIVDLDEKGWPLLQRAPMLIPT